MKTYFLSFVGVLMISILISCDPAANTDTSPAQAVTSGSWRVTLFTDSGNDETSDFAGYRFTFSDNGSIHAVKAGVTKTGTWSINSSSGKFNIDLGIKSDSNKPLGELTDDWKIISHSATEFRLTDDNAGSNEFLTFTKSN